MRRTKEEIERSIVEEVKTCRKCGELKDFSKFSADKSQADGMFPICRSCRSESRCKVRGPSNKRTKREIESDKLLGSKVCNTCKNRKPLDSFYQNKGKESHATCKACILEYHKLHHRQKKYGLSKQDYIKIHDNQEGKCTICGYSGSLVVDHDHKTGDVRALLCHLCNTGLGFFRDNPEYLIKASDYLIKHNKE